MTINQEEINEDAQESEGCPNGITPDGYPVAP